MQKQLEQYESAVQSLRAATLGLNRSQLRAYPIPGTWSIHQIVVHLTDCEQVFADRMKRVIAEDRPVLAAFDENLWMQNLAVEGRSTEECVELLELVRRQMSRILRELPPGAFQRTGRHSEQGDLSLSDLLGKCNWHWDHHMQFLLKKRDLVMAGVEAGVVTLAGQ
jgi:hypothetical protein